MKINIKKLYNVNVGKMCDTLAAVCLLNKLSLVKYNLSYLFHQEHIYLSKKVTNNIGMYFFNLNE